jgi:hypothetical protein
MHSQKKEKLKLYPEDYPVEWWMMQLFSCESPSLDLNFCYLSLNLTCSYFLGKLNLTNSWKCLTLNLRDLVSSEIGLLGGVWKVISLPFCLPKAGRLFEPGFLPVWWVVFPSLVPAPHWVLLFVQGPHPGKPGGQVQVPPLDQAVHWCLAGSLLLAVWGMYPSNKGGENHSLHNLGWASKKYYGKLKQRLRTLRQGSNALLYQHRLRGFMSKVWALRTKGSHLSTLVSRLQRQ